MRTLLVLVALPVVLASTALVACGGDEPVTIAGNDASTSGGDSAGGDHDGGGGSDSGTSNDGSPSGDSASGGDSSTANDTGTAQACTSPAGCTATTPVCCGTIMVTGGMVPNCTTNPPVVECKTSAACPTTLGTTCSGTQVVRLCAANADCTEPSNNKCCAFTRDGGVLSFCSSAFVAGIAGGTCM